MDGEWAGRWRYLLGEQRWAPYHGEVLYAHLVLGLLRADEHQMADNATQRLVLNGAEPGEQLPIDGYLLGGHRQLGDKHKAVGQFAQQSFRQIAHEALQHVGHVVLIVLVARDLHVERVRPEGAHQLVHGILRAGLAVNALRHGAMNVHKIDALINNHGHVVARQLLIAQREAVIVRHLPDDVTPDLCLARRAHYHVDGIRRTVDHQHWSALHVQIINGLIALL